MDFDPQVSKALMAAIQQLQEMSPEIADILAKAKSGEMSENVAMTNLLEAVMSDSTVADRFQDLMREALTPLRDDAPMAKRNPVNGPIEGAAVHFLPRGGRGLPQINPLFQAALVERAQFDGDMPELRTGNIPIGVNPAVPVKTTARNPVAIGMMLKAASDEIAKALRDHSGEQCRLVEENLMEGTSLTIATDAATDLAGSVATDLAGYRRGESPKLRLVPEPSGAELATMPEAQRHEMTWRFLSTTQGRVSAVEILRDTIAVQLRARGFTVEEREFNAAAIPRVQPLAYAEWSVTMAGPGATQPAFALVDVSSKTLAYRLFENLVDKTPRNLFLEVEPINRISDREVGWMARLMP